MTNDAALGGADIHQLFRSASATADIYKSGPLSQSIRMRQSDNRYLPTATNNPTGTPAGGAGGGREMADFTLQALNDEIDNDPEGIGYKNPDTTWKENQVIADLINAKNYTIDTTAIEMESGRSTTTYDAYNTLAIDEQEWLRWMTPNSGQLVITADVKLQLTGRALTSNGTAGTGNDSNSFWAAAHRGVMAPAFLALIEKAGSRAEVLWNEGINITVSQISTAATL